MKALVQVCSARNVTPFKHVNALVRLEFLGDNKETVVKKNCGDRPIWNSVLSFVIPPGDLSRHELKVRCLHVVGKKRMELGAASMFIASTPSELVDTWVILESKGKQTGISVHLCVQVEPIFTSKPAVALPSVLLNAGDGSEHGDGDGDEHDDDDDDEKHKAAAARQQYHAARQRTRSDFEGHAAAVTLNEVTTAPNSTASLPGMKNCVRK